MRTRACQWVALSLGAIAVAFVGGYLLALRTSRDDQSPVSVSKSDPEAVSAVSSELFTPSDNADMGRAFIALTDDSPPLGDTTPREPCKLVLDPNQPPRPARSRHRSAIVATTAGDLEARATKAAENREAMAVDSHGLLPSTGTGAMSEPNPTDNHAPQPLPMADDAVPVSDSKVHAKAIRAIIKQQLPNATDTEVEIWYNELKNFTPQMATDLLQVRRNLGTSNMTSVLDSKEPAATPAVPEPKDLDSRHGESTDAETDSTQCSLSEVALMNAVKRAIRIASLNSVNAQTIGYKRSRIELSLPASSTSDETHQCNAETQIDCTQGRIVDTGRLLDIAIDGPGFLQVVAPASSETLFTRNGNLVRDSQGRLAVRAGNRLYHIEPEIRIDAGITRLSISHEGLIAANEGASDSQILGQLKLTRFFDPTALKRRGNVFFQPTPETGKPFSHTPATNGFGSIQQYCLEASNARWDAEQESLKRLRHQLEVLDACRDTL